MKYKICLDYHYYGRSIEEINKGNNSYYHITADLIESWMGIEDIFRSVLRQIANRERRMQPVQKTERRCLNYKTEPYYATEKELMESPLVFQKFTDLISYEEVR